MFEHDTESCFLSDFLGERLSDFSKIYRKCKVLSELKLQTLVHSRTCVSRFYSLNLLTFYLLWDTRDILTSPDLQIFPMILQLWQKIDAFDRPLLGTPFVLSPNFINANRVACGWFSYKTGTHSTVRYWCTLISKFCFSTLNCLHTYRPIGHIFLTY